VPLWATGAVIAILVVCATAAVISIVRAPLTLVKDVHRKDAKALIPGVRNLCIFRRTDTAHTGALRSHGTSARPYRGFFIGHDWFPWQQQQENAQYL